MIQVCSEFRGVQNNGESWVLFTRQWCVGPFIQQSMDLLMCLKTSIRLRGLRSVGGNGQGLTPLSWLDLVLVAKSPCYGCRWIQRRCEEMMVGIVLRASILGV